MTVQDGSKSLGHDPSLTVTEQLSELHKRLAFYLKEGRDGTSVVESVRQQIANLEQHQKNHQAAHKRAASELALQSSTNPNGTTAPVYAKPLTKE